MWDRNVQHVPTLVGDDLICEKNEDAHNKSHIKSGLTAKLLYALYGQAAKQTIPV